MHDIMTGLATLSGVWNGAFLTYSLDGGRPRLTGTRPSVLVIESIAPNVIRQTNRYADGRSLIMEVVDTDGSIAVRGVGDIQIPPAMIEQFLAATHVFPSGANTGGVASLDNQPMIGIEQGFVHGDRRRRIVAQFSTDGELTSATVIRETRASDYAEPEGDPLDAALLDHGDWETVEHLTYPAADLPSTPPPDRRILLPGDCFLRLPERLPTQGEDRSFTAAMGWLADPDTLYTVERRHGPDSRWAGSAIRRKRRLAGRQAE